MLGLGIGLGFNRVIGVPFLLDKFSGAAAAYSLRALSASTTDVVRVRRSSDNAEQDFSADEITDGSFATWVGAGNDGFVTTWYDQAGSNDAVQVTASAQPKIVDAGSLVTENGKAAIDFDLSDFIQTASIQAVNLSDGSFASFGVYRVNTADGNGIPIGHDGLSNRVTQITRSLQASQVWGTLQFRLGGTTNVKAESQVNSDYYNTQVLVYSANETGSLLVGVNQIDGTPAAITSPTIATAPVAIFGRGDGGSDGGGIAQEIIIYPSDQSSNRTAIETNINDYYSIY